MFEECNFDEIVEKHKKVIAYEGKDEIFRFMQERNFLSKLNRFINYNSQKRYDLFTNGFLTLGYCYITFDENNERFRANVLIAPSKGKNDLKNILLETYDNLLNFYKKYSNREISHNRFNKILYNNLFSAEEEPSFFNVPDEYTDYNFVQVCSMEFEKDFAMPKEPGKFFIPVLFNSKISSLVMPYPDKYLSKLLKV